MGESDKLLREKLELASAESSARLVSMVEGIKDEKIRAETIRAIIEKTVENEACHRTGRLALALAGGCTAFLAACVTTYNVASLALGSK